MLSDYFLLVPSFIEFPFLKANSVDPDQMLHSVVFDLDLHCLPFYRMLGINGLTNIIAIFVRRKMSFRHQVIIIRIF